MASFHKQLSGKTALVTGSSQGIGEAIALIFAEAGAHVLIHYRKHRAQARAVLSKIWEQGGTGALLQADLSKAGSPSRLFEKAGKHANGVDILVLNASVQLPALWTDITPEAIDIQVNTNFKSTLQLMQLFSPAMCDRGWGRIVTIGSVQQSRPHPSMAVYAATKSAVRNLVRNIAIQLADKGVTVNNLAPGVIDTPRIDEPVPTSEKRIMDRMEIPMQKIGEPRDCAEMALLLCSEAGRFITGQNIYIDGGMSL